MLSCSVTKKHRVLIPEEWLQGARDAGRVIHCPVTHQTKTHTHTFLLQHNVYLSMYIHRYMIVL